MKITIDTQEIEFKGKKTILELARENDIYIPSLCDYVRLTPFTGCRLCIVEVKGRKGYLPSCAVNADDGMEIKTKTPRLQKLRKQILELILSEHPNSCLICSEKDNCDEYKSTIRKVGEVTGCVLCSNNGRCELQDVVEALKIEKVEFPSLYRNIEIKKSDPFFDRNFNLCILCGRCVRICQEVRGAAVLSFVSRGSQAVVGTVLDQPLLETGCQFCGACVDVCPTGALTERAIKYETLPDKITTTVCPFCSMGCELEIALREGKILDSKPSKKGEVNQGQACVKGRFIVRNVVHSSQRILKPLVRVNRDLEEVSWEEAIGFTVKRLKKYTGKKVACVGSLQTTCEDNYVFHKFAREVLKTENIDSLICFSPLEKMLKAAREKSFTPDFNFNIEEIAEARTVFLFGEDIPVSHPIIWLTVLRALNSGANLIVVSPTELSLNRFSSLWLKIKPGSDLALLHFLSKTLIENGKAEDIAKVEHLVSFKDSLGKIDYPHFFEQTGLVQEELEEAARLLSGEGPMAFLFGMGLTQHPWGGQNFEALWNLAQITHARLYPLGLENNQRGEFEIKRHFAPKGKTYDQIIQAVSSGDIKSLYCVGPVPSLEKVSLEFMIVQDSFINENSKKADVVFPAATFAETEGIFINTEGRIQKFNKVIEPQGEAKADWWIISKLAQKMGYKGFDYRNPSGIMRELSKVVGCFRGVSYPNLLKSNKVFAREENKREKQFIPLKYNILPYKISKKYPYFLCLQYNLDYYRSLSLPREIEGLRRIRNPQWIEMSPKDAKDLGLKEGENVVVESSFGKIKGLVKIIEAIPGGVFRAGLLWGEDSNCFTSNLMQACAKESNSLGMIPVKIKRGK